MKKHAGIFLFLLVVIPLLSPSAALGDGYMDSVKTAMLIDAQKLLLNDRFSAADSLYEIIIGRYPDDPDGYFFRAAALMNEMTDREENLHEDRYLRLLDTVEYLAERKIPGSSPRTRAWMYLFSGHARAYRSIWQSRFGSFLSALKTAFDARDQYEKGLEADSTLADLYLGLGSYHYWKSAKAGVLRWVGIFKNQKEQGLEELRYAAGHSLLSKEPARAALVWVRLDMKQYDSAIAVASTGVEKYPEGKSLLWPLAQAYYLKKDFTEALRVYRQLRDKISPDPGNYYNLIECDYYIYQCLENLEKNDEARTAARRTREYIKQIPKETYKRQRSHLDELKRAART